MTAPEAGPASRVAALILAAGAGRRMGGPNKLLAEIGGVSLIRKVALAGLQSRADAVLVVTGHRAADVDAALASLDVRSIHNPDHAEGLSTSLRTGVAALGGAVDGALILLADMPFVDRALIDRMIAAFEQAGATSIIAPRHDGRRGNPVLWPRRLFPQLMAIAGDKGGRDLLVQHAAAIVEIEAGPAVSIDIDTPEALDAVGGRIGS